MINKREYCPTCKSFAPEILHGRPCWRCALNNSWLTGEQIITVAQDAQGLFTWESAPVERKETKIVFPDREYTVTFLVNNPNITHVLRWGEYEVHATFESPVSPINGVHQCVNWIINTRNLARLRGIDHA